MHSKTPKSLLETSEGCPSPFTRLAEGRISPALISFSISAQSGFASACQHAASLRSAAPSHQQVVPNPFHERRTEPPQELVPMRCTAGPEREKLTAESECRQARSVLRGAKRRADKPAQPAC